MNKILEQLPNPKRDKSSGLGRSGWYPYYAGYSAIFAEKALQLTAIREPKVLDPWNGSGTTTAVAASKGYDSFGFDLNPAMIIVARARLLNKRERTSLLPLAKLVCQLSFRPTLLEIDPLTTWFKPTSARLIRQLEHGIQKALLGLDEWVAMERYMIANEISDIVAFFYVALFRTVRNLLRNFQSSNPTWLKSPTLLAERLSPSFDTIVRNFIEQIKMMESALDGDNLEKDGKVRIEIAKSQAVPLPSGSVDFVLSSPPYCTRIDYASATRAELAVLGMGDEKSLRGLRSSLLGTPTVPKIAPTPQMDWGSTCGKFLEAVASHPSKASRGYYYKGHCQYFQGIFESIKEVSRCLSSSGMACIVVQDSYYKDIHNDLPTIFSEMGANLGLSLHGRRDFLLTRCMGSVNTASRAYRKSGSATESILLFTK